MVHSNINDIKVDCKHGTSTSRPHSTWALICWIQLVAAFTLRMGRNKESTFNDDMTDDVLCDGYRFDDGRMLLLSMYSTSCAGNPFNAARPKEIGLC
mmetsp:Transcript_10644/g.29386  ORF Transcript_10644/g.29386 Transcript_10644/m.29386 type:complete len:97 (-) Transcript_10644:548-838(-)